MRTEELAKSYAMALYEVVFEKQLGVLKQVHEQLKAKPQLVFELTDPQAHDAAKRQLLRSLLPGQATEDEEMENFLLNLAREGRLGMLEEIIEQFEALAAAKQRLTPAVVTTAVPLSDDEMAAIKSRLTARYGERLDFRFEVVPDILGGVVVRVAGRVIDDSVAGRLAALRAQLGVTEQ